MKIRSVSSRKTHYALLLATACAAVLPASAETLYWDLTAGVAGAGGATPSGTWNSASWNPMSDGTGALQSFISGVDSAVFSAGSDAVGAYTVNLSAAQTAASVLVEEGTVSLSGSALTVGPLTIESGAKFSIPSTLNLLPLSGAQIFLNGGTFRNTSNGAGSTFANIGFTINIGTAGGFLEATNTGTNSAIFQGSVVGVGNTLTKIGSGELRLQGAAQANNTFSKLVVKEGLYRLGNVSGNNHETAFGGVPASVLTDAITIDGGQLGTSASIALHANRGITIGPGGGTFNGSGGGTFTVPGPLSGSGRLILIGGGGLNLQNAGNITSFTGAVEVNVGTLTLTQSLNATNFSGTGGTVSVASSRIFTVGSDNTATSYSGVVAGAGQFTKIGIGVFGTRNEWTNTGATNINEGTLRFEISAAGLGNASTINIGASGTLDMNNVNDTIGALAGGGSIINGANVTLAGNNSAAATFSGNYTGTAASRVLTKNASVATSVQVLSGTNDFTAVNFNGGDLRLNSNTALNGASGPTPISVGAAVAPTSDNTGAGSIGVSSGTVDIPNAIILNGGAENLKLHATSGNTARFNGVISGTGGLLRENFGAGTVVLNGQNSFQGGVKVAGRGLTLGNKSALGSGTLTLGDVTTEPAAPINIIAGIDLSDLNAITNALVANRDFTLSGDNLEFTSNLDLGSGLRVITASNAPGKRSIFSGNLIGATGGLSKLGAGTLELAGLANTFGGLTSVSEGTLLITGNVIGTTGVEVDGTGTLGGEGSIAPILNGNIVVLAGGKLSPGSSVGTLEATLSGTGKFDISGGIAANTGGLVFDLDTTSFSDQVTLTGGPLVIGDGLLGFEDFAFTALSGFGPGDYLLFTSDTSISGTLGNNLAGFVGGLSAEIRLEGGNDVMLRVVPEPGSTVFLLGGLALTMFRRRRG